MPEVIHGQFLTLKQAKITGSFSRFYGKITGSFSRMSAASPWLARPPAISPVALFR